MLKILEVLHDTVWGIPALVLMIGVGLYLSIISGVPQICFFPRALKGLFHKTDISDGTVTPLQALCTALGTTVGTGNLIGVAGAICLGGPGAIFWMWVCGLLGMATKYAEVTLAVRYRTRCGNEFVGGPMYMIRDGLGRHWQWLAVIYAFLGIFAAFGVGNATQINAVISGINILQDSFGIASSKLINLTVGVVIAVILGALLYGGATRIGKVAEKMIPFFSAGYLLLCVGTLIWRADRVLVAFSEIFIGAWNPEAVTGGIIGSLFMCLRIGCARGIFSNEAGMGTASIAHASAKVKHPVEQGMMGLLEVFIDTILICTLTALTILCSDVLIPYGEDQGAILLNKAFCTVYGQWASVVLTMLISAFAFATVLGWGLYGNCFGTFLFGPDVRNFFIWIQMGAVILGAVLDTSSVWSLAETVNGMMAIPNLIALAALGPELRRLSIEYKRGG